MIFPFRRVVLVCLCTLIASCPAVIKAAANTATANGQPGPADFEALLTTTRRLQANEPQRAVEVAREALKSAPLQPQPIAAEIRARTHLAEALRMTSNYGEARTVIDAALALPASESTKLERAQALHGSGQIFWNRGDYAQAEASFVAAQKDAEIVQDQRLLARVLNSRGIVARHQKNLPLSAELFEEALVAAGEETDLKLQIQNNLAVLYIDMGQFDKARELFNANLAAHTASNNRRSIANANINLAIVEASAGNHEAALNYNTKALALRQELGVPRHIASAQIAVATSLTKLGRADEALTYLHTARTAADKLASHELWANLYTAFRETYAARGDFKEALEFQLKAEQENQVVAGEKTNATVAELRERFDAEKRERELSELHATQMKQDAELGLQESELRRHRLERYAFFAVVILSGIAALAIISRHRAKARAERLILDQTRQARDAAEAANRVKTHLLDLASHDLKAPLVGVMMTADILVEESSGQKNITEPARAIRAESERMFNLVQALLDGSAVEANRLELALAPIELNGLVVSTIPLFQRRAARKQQQVEFVPSPAEAMIQGDYTRLQQVVENLVDNALKFSQPNTITQISIEHRGDKVLLIVQDEGPGLTPEDQRSLFQKFTKLSARPTGNESSNGLGLALVKEIVELHQGRIWAESASTKGTQFIAEFPAAQPLSSAVSSLS